VTVSVVGFDDAVGALAAPRGKTVLSRV
jgi:hypothetical protein